MAGNTTIPGPRGSGHVLRMIELHVKALFEFIGESFQRRIVAAYAGVADRAHRHVRRGELRKVAAGAIFVSGEARSRRVVTATMTA